MGLVKWEISVAVTPMVVGSTLSLVGTQDNAALWLQQISVIIFEADIVAEQKQTYWSQCVCFYNFPLS